MSDPKIYLAKVTQYQNGGMQIDEMPDAVLVPRDAAQWFYDEFMERTQPIKGGMRGRVKARLHFIALRDSLAAKLEDK